jgi:hypothetical protein
MVTVQSGFRTRDLSITSPTCLPIALSRPNHKRRRRKRRRRRRSEEEKERISSQRKLTFFALRK